MTTVILYQKLKYLQNYEMAGKNTEDLPYSQEEMADATVQESTVDLPQQSHDDEQNGAFYLPNRAGRR